VPAARRQVIFTSLGTPNYRMFAVAQFFTSTGIAVQRVAGEQQPEEHRPRPRSSRVARRSR
jgi:hypothetical protein